MNEILYFAMGFVGAMVHEIVDDNKLTLPRVDSGEIILGFLGSAIIGGVVGIVADHNPLNALMAGYVGISVIKNLTVKTLLEKAH